METNTDDLRIKAGTLFKKQNRLIRRDCKDQIVKIKNFSNKFSEFQVE